MRPATFYPKPDMDLRSSLLLCVYQEANSATSLSSRVDSGTEHLVMEEVVRVTEQIRWETTQ